MGRLFRWAAWTGTALGLLVVGALLTLRRMYPPEKIRAIALERIEKALGREVRLKTVSIGLRGLELGGIEVSEAPDFRAGTFLQARSLMARWDLRALLRRRVAISEVALSGFDCRVVQDSSGRLNVAASAPRREEASARAASPAEPRAPAARPKTSAPPSGGGFEVSVRRVLADGGTVVYQPASGKPVRVTELRARVADFKPEAEFPASLSFHYDAAGAKGRLDFSGRLRQGRDGSVRVHFDPLKLEHDRVTLSLSGDADRAASGTVKVAATGTVPSLKGAALELKGLVSPAEGKGPARIDASVRASGVPIEALAAFAPPIAAYRVRGVAALDVRATGAADAPALSGTGRLTSVAATLAGLPLSEATIDLAFDPREARAKTSGRFGGAPLSLDARALDYRAAPDVRVEGKLGSLDLAALASSAPAAPPAGGPSAPEETPRASPEPTPAPASPEKPASGRAAPASPPIKTSGRLEIGAIKHPRFHAESARAEWSLSGVAADLSRLSGKAALRVGSGKFEDLKELAAKSQLARVALLPLFVLQKAAGLAKVPFLPNFDKVAFKEITGDYTFQNGAMTVRESHMDSSAGYVTTTGGADLARDRLDLRIADKFRGTTIAFFVRGSLADPQVKPDVQEILKQPGVEKAIEQGQKLLKDIFRR